MDVLVSQGRVATLFKWVQYKPIFYVLLNDFGYIVI